MATAVKTPARPLAKIQLDANELASAYVALSHDLAPLEAEVKKMKQQQDKLRESLAGLLNDYPALLNEKRSVETEAALLTLRKAPAKLAYELDKYDERALLALLKKLGLEGQCVEVKVKAAEVIKACAYVGKLPAQLQEIGVSVAEESYGLVITAKATAPLADAVLKK